MLSGFEGQRISFYPTMKVDFDRIIDGPRLSPGGEVDKIAGRRERLTLREMQTGRKS